MKKKEEDGFGFLGVPYQKRLIAQFITDIKFAGRIMDIIEPNYFTDQHLRIIAAEIKDAYDENEVIPDFESLGIRLKSRTSSDHVKTFLLAQVDEIKEQSLNDSEFIQDRALKFCRQQSLKKSIREMTDVIDNGDLADFDGCEDILKKALEVGNDSDDSIDVLSNINDVLSADFRKPIPTGILGLDDKMDGGLAKGELGVILAPFGVGKTTMITKLANTAFDLGYNVLQVFFEDIPKVIQRKHISCWSKIPLNDLAEAEHRAEIDALIKEKGENKGYLKLKKFSSDGTTIPTIKKYVRRLQASGLKPDIILLDYIDCVSASKNFDKEYEAEGAVMRQFESLLSEFDMVGWTAIQGNRSSIGASEVTSDMIGGSIKKGQIGHFIVSIAKTLDQKEEGRANMAILKSRFGVDGIIFSDVLFDNARIQIVIDDNSWKTASETEKHKSEGDLLRIKDLLKIQKEKRDNEDNNEDNNDNNNNNNE